MLQSAMRRKAPAGVVLAVLPRDHPPFCCAAYAERARGAAGRAAARGGGGCGRAARGRGGGAAARAAAPARMDAQRAKMILRLKEDRIARLQARRMQHARWVGAAQ